MTDGTFKVPSLRNLELTAPYFHNGGQRTIRQVVEFYNRGGDFREHNVLNIDFEIGKLNLTESADRRSGRISRPTVDRPARRSNSAHRSIIRSCSCRTATPCAVAVHASPRKVWLRTSSLEIPAVGRHGGPLPAGFLQ